MDRRRRRAWTLALVLALGASGGLRADPAPALRAMRWIAAETDPVGVFTTAPTECLKRPTTAPERLSVEIGRAAFRTPLLLGGQAARAGLSCESCHRSGRDNPDFQFPGASGAPGTADVTLSLFSSHRGNSFNDPKTIPDLSGPRDRLKVAPNALPTFIRGLIVEEFDGAEPTPATLTGLAAYVSALRPEACPRNAQTPITPAALLADARRAVRAAQGANDARTAILMIAAARAQLGLIHERYGTLSTEQARLRKADAALAALQNVLRRDRREATKMASDWHIASEPLKRALEAKVGLSLFNPSRLSQAANRRLPAKPT